MTGSAISSYKSSSGRNHKSTRSCLNNALARQIHHKSISDNCPDAVISQLLRRTLLLQSRPLCLVFLPNPDSFFSVKAHQSRAPLSLAAVQYCMAWLQGHMLSRCGFCVESLGGSACYLMIGRGSDLIAADSGLLFPFAMNLSDLFCNWCFSYKLYTNAAHVKNVSCINQHVVDNQRDLRYTVQYISILIAAPKRQIF